MMKKRSVVLLAVIALVLAGCSSGGDGDSGNGDTASQAEKENEEQVPLGDEALYEQAVEDAVFAEESEILPLVTLTKEDEMTTWDEQGRVLLCTWHNYPESYPQGEKVKLEWGQVWAFTDKEMASHADELEDAEDPKMRLSQIIGFAPDSEHSTVTEFWVDPSDVCRPAYQNDPADGSMKTAFEEDVDEEFKEWFDENTLDSYFYGSSPWTRLGYTYDWADNGTEYGLTEFLIDQGAEVEVEFTGSTEDFLERILEG